MGRFQRNLDDEEGWSLRGLKMLKIGFYASNLSERGTAVALFDYARYNQEILQHDSIIFYNKNFPENNEEVIRKFKKRFEVISCDNFNNADVISVREGCDLIYVIKSGEPDGLSSKVVPTMVHGVFPISVQHVHGASFAFVSEWLSMLCTRRLVPWVPHIVSVSNIEEDMRHELGIPTDALVFGAYGGRDSFNIGFVKDRVIPDVLDTDPTVFFLFMNIQPFIEHPRVMFLPGTADLEIKTVFINTCNAMLHARFRGETFGLAIGEFTLRGKPIFTYSKSLERAHLLALGEAAITYKSAAELFSLIVSFEKSAPSAKEFFSTAYAPETVMTQFSKHLIEPAKSPYGGGAQRRLGLSRWDPSLLMRRRVNKYYTKYIL